MKRARFMPLALLAFSLHAQSVADVPYESVANFLKLPNDIYLGEVVGVATNSKGNIFVYTRTGGVVMTEGTAIAFERGSSRLLEFDSRGKFLREIAPGLYGFTFGHGVRVDPQDNIWVIDEGSNMLIKFSPEGRVLMVMGRKPEALRVPAPPVPAVSATGKGLVSDVFDRPSDVAWDANGNFFVADGHGNSRIAKFDKNGVFQKSWGARGKGQGQFDTPHSIATDAAGNVYVADQGNRRIQVFDNSGTFKSQIANVGAPAAICITPGPHQYLYASNSNDPGNLDNGEIYKLELDGRILGKFGRAGKVLREFGTVNAIDCRDPNGLLVGEVLNWRVQKLLLHPAQ